MKITPTLTNKNNKKGKTSVYLRCKYEGEDLKVYIPALKVKPSDWDPKKERVRDTNPDHDKINGLIDSWKVDIRAAINGLEGLMEEVTVPNIERWIETRGDFDCPATRKNLPLLDYYDLIVKRKREEENLTDKYMVQFDWSRMFLARFVKQRPVRICRVNKPYLVAYLSFLQRQSYAPKGENGNRRKYAKNTIHNLFMKLGSVMEVAMQERIIPPIELGSIGTRREIMDSVYLTFAQIRTLAAVQVHTSIEKIVRDLFVFNCYCGLRWSDLTKLKETNFKEIEGKGKMRIQYMYVSKKTRKTNGKRVRLIMFPPAERILREYNFRLPKVELSEFNETIRILALRAGLTEVQSVTITRGANEEDTKDMPAWKRISSHTARRSFCTNYYNQGIFGISFLKNYTQHEREDQFLAYVRGIIPEDTQFDLIDKAHPDEGSSDSSMPLAA